MGKYVVLAGLILLLVACTTSPSYRTEAECDQTPVVQGETGFCDYYPGFGWARVPHRTTIRTD